MASEEPITRFQFVSSCRNGTRGCERPIGTPDLRQELLAEDFDGDFLFEAFAWCPGEMIADLGDIASLRDSGSTSRASNFRAR